jgi:hypothetical protein
LILDALHPWTRLLVKHELSMMLQNG